MYTLLSDSRKINISNLLFFYCFLATLFGGFDSVLLTNRFSIGYPPFAPFFIREKAGGKWMSIYVYIIHIFFLNYTSLSKVVAQKSSPFKYLSTGLNQAARYAIQG